MSTEPVAYEYEIVLRVVHREIPNPDMPSLNVNALAQAIVEGINLDGVGAGQDIAVEVKATWFHGEAKR